MFWLREYVEVGACVEVGDFLLRQSSRRLLDAIPTNSAAILKRMHRTLGRDFKIDSGKLTRACRFSPANWEGKMRFFGAALVCIAVLCGVDAFFFDGRYGDGIDRIISTIYQHW
jgi:hypothetical protein